MDLNLSIKEIKSIISVERCDLDDNFVVERIASFGRAQGGDLAVVFNRGDASVFDPISVKDIQDSAAGVFLATQAAVDGKKYLIVKDVLTAFSELVAWGLQSQQRNSRPAKIAEDALVHKSAVVEQGTVIGAGTKIGALAYIGDLCVIGNNVLIHPGVKILERCVVGDGTIIHSGAVIGSDGFGYEVGKAGLRKIPHIGIVRIGKAVEIGAQCAVDRAAFDETVIGDGVKIDNSVHIAHNVKIGASSAILAQTGIAGSTEIGYGCQIGGQVAIKDHVKIGNGAKIVSKSAVMNNLDDGQIVAGIPAIPFMQWKRLTAALSRVPELMKRFGSEATTTGTAKKTWWQRLFF